MTLPMVSMHFFMPLELIQKLDERVKDKTYKTRAEALRTYVQLGIRVEEFKKITQDPEKYKEFLTTMNQSMESGSILQWIEGLDSSKISGLEFALSMEREKRFKQTHLGFVR